MTDPPECSPADLVAALFEARVAGDDKAAAALVALWPDDPADDAEE